MNFITHEVREKMGERKRENGKWEIRNTMVQIDK